MMTSEPTVTDFWSKRSDEAGTKARKSYALSPRACFGILRTIKVGTSKWDCFRLRLFGRVKADLGLGLMRRRRPWSGPWNARGTPDRVVWF